MQFIYRLNDDHMSMGYVYRIVCYVRKTICKEVGEATEKIIIRMVRDQSIRSWVYQQLKHYLNSVGAFREGFKLMYKTVFHQLSG